jgi:hypothetical protein
MAITKQRVKKIEESLSIDEERDVRIFYIKNLNKMDAQEQKELSDRKLAEIRKKEGNHLSPFIFLTDKDAVEAAKQRIKEREKEELLDNQN